MNYQYYGATTAAATPTAAAMPNLPTYTAEQWALLTPEQQTWHMTQWHQQQAYYTQWQQQIQAAQQAAAVAQTPQYPPLPPQPQMQAAWNQWAASTMAPGPNGVATTTMAYGAGVQPAATPAVAGMQPNMNYQYYGAATAAATPTAATMPNLPTYTAEQWALLTPEQQTWHMTQWHQQQAYYTQWQQQIQAAQQAVAVAQTPQYPPLPPQPQPMVSLDREGSGRDDRLGSSRDDRPGSGRDDRLGSGRDDRLGSSREDRLGSGREDRLGSNRDDRLGSGRDDRLGRKFSNINLTNNRGVPVIPGLGDSKTDSNDSSGADGRPGDKPSDNTKPLWTSDNAPFNFPQPATAAHPTAQGGTSGYANAQANSYAGMTPGAGGQPNAYAGMTPNAGMAGQGYKTDSNDSSGADGRPGDKPSDNTKPLWTSDNAPFNFPQPATAAHPTAQGGTSGYANAQANAYAGMTPGAGGQPNAYAGMTPNAGMAGQGYGMPGYPMMPGQMYNPMMQYQYPGMQGMMYPPPTPQQPAQPPLPPAPAPGQQQPNQQTNQQHNQLNNHQQQQHQQQGYGVPNSQYPGNNQPNQYAQTKPGAPHNGPGAPNGGPRKSRFSDAAESRDSPNDYEMNNRGGAPPRGPGGPGMRGPPMGGGPNMGPPGGRNSRFGPPPSHYVDKYAKKYEEDDETEFENYHNRFAAEDRMEEEGAGLNNWRSGPGGFNQKEGGYGGNRENFGFGQHRDSFGGNRENSFGPGGRGGGPNNRDFSGRESFGPNHGFGPKEQFGFSNHAPGVNKGRPDGPGGGFGAGPPGKSRWGGGRGEGEIENQPPPHEPTPDPVDEKPHTCVIVEYNHGKTPCAMSIELVKGFNEPYKGPVFVYEYSHGANKAEFFRAGAVSPSIVGRRRSPLKDKFTSPINTVSGRDTRPSPRHDSNPGDTRNARGSETFSPRDSDPPARNLLTQALNMLRRDDKDRRSPEREGRKFRDRSPLDERNPRRDRSPDERGRGNRGYSGRDDRLSSGRDDRLGSSRDDRLGSSRDDRPGSGRDDRLGSGRDDRFGSSREDQSGSGREDRLGSGRDDRLGLGRDDRFSSSRDDRFGLSKFGEDRRHSVEDRLADQRRKMEENSRHVEQKNIAIEDILDPPGRASRPDKIAVFLRGPPSSGKSFLAKIIKDREAQNGQNLRILSLDDYFMTNEVEKEIIDERGMKKKIKAFEYEYEKELEESYRQSLVKSFKKNVNDAYFSFIIVDANNDQLSHYSEMYLHAKKCRDRRWDVQFCLTHNAHHRNEEDIRHVVNKFQVTPREQTLLDVTSLLQSAEIEDPMVSLDREIEDVEMEDVSNDEDTAGVPDAPVETVTLSDDEEDDIVELEASKFTIPSKWDNIDHSIGEIKAKLDGLSKKSAAGTIKDWLNDENEDLSIYNKTRGSGRKKQVRWADIEEKYEQDKMKAIGFIVGGTDWDRMMDPNSGTKRMNQTKYI
ncbi:YLP motif-containing protein 1-like [Diaphorina citri]|uniref:YLP motif-containing protein 1-like n=1 Tax=Diaphorina citri TaxID=121845 RepID=A0A3Q0ISH0_DIACI|nr:YLP motif-containing protein 1-like [Diaphorina citri]